MASTNRKNRQKRLKSVLVYLKDERSEENKKVSSSSFDISGQILKLGAFISIIGFFLINSITRQFTSILSFNISPQAYLAMGGSIALIFVLRILLIPLVILFSLLYVLFFLAFYIKTKKLKIISSLQLTQEAINFVLSNPVTWLAIFFWVLSYAINPADLLSIGNGSPVQGNKSSVHLIFKDNIDTSLWHLSVDPNEPKGTQEVSIIIEYSDGLLVRDLNTGAVVKVNSDMLAGIVDDRSFDPTKLTTPTSTGTATP